MLIEGNALKIRTIRSILVKSGDIGQNFRTLSFSERCFDTQTNIYCFMTPRHLAAGVFLLVRNRQKDCEDQAWAASLSGDR